MNEPLVDLICTALDLMNKAFVDVRDSQSMAREFYHQFRKLWDRGIPVGMKLGHLTTITEPGVDVAIQRLGEHGQPTVKLAAIQFAPSPAVPGFAHTIVITTSPSASPDVTTILFDPNRWVAKLLSPL